MKPKALVFIYNKEDEKDGDISSKITPYFTAMVNNLVAEKYIESKEEFDEIADNQHVYFMRGEDDKFSELLGENMQDKIADVARTAYLINTQMKDKDKISEDVNAIVYDGSKAPWKFDLILAVIYEVDD